MPSSALSHDCLAAKTNHSQAYVANYQRHAIRSRVMHLGVGAFHRAHQAVYFDRLLAQDEAWGITGVNLRPQDSAAFATLQAQQGEYFLKTMDAIGTTEYHHIRSLVKLIDGAQQPQEVDQVMADPAIVLLTTTVTEGGYYLNEAGELLVDDPAIAADLQQNGRNTLYAFLQQGLRRRMECQSGPITLLCCDNLRHNGKLLESGFKQFLKAAGDEVLLSWVVQNSAFPCSMVDRITPKPDNQHSQDVQHRFGIEDTMCVMAEDYLQWVIEDKFAAAKPALDQVGVQYVKDVAPFEEAKIRLLNAGHTIISYQAALAGLHTYDEAMREPVFKRFLEDFAQYEAIPAIGDSVVDLADYFEVIVKRFSNEFIGDTLERICTDGYAKFPIFVLPTLEGCYQKAIEPKLTIAAIASWFLFIQKIRDQSLTMTYHEPNWNKLERFTHDANGIQAFATDTALWGDVPLRFPQFVSALSECIQQQLISSG